MYLEFSRSYKKGQLKRLHRQQKAGCAHLGWILSYYTSLISNYSWNGNKIKFYTEQKSFSWNFFLSKCWSSRNFKNRKLVETTTIRNILTEYRILQSFENIFFGRVSGLSRYFWLPINDCFCGQSFKTYDSLILSIELLIKSS